MGEVVQRAGGSFLLFCIEKSRPARAGHGRGGTASRCGFSIPPAIVGPGFLHRNFTFCASLLGGHRAHLPFGKKLSFGGMLPSGILWGCTIACTAPTHTP